MRHANAKIGCLFLPLELKAKITCETLLPAGFFGAIYMPPKEAKMKQLIKAATAGIWGPKHKMRSPEGVLCILLKAHTHHPEAVLEYRIFNSMVDNCIKMPYLMGRVMSIKKRYEENPKLERNLGPVGNFITRSLNKLEMEWKGDLNFREKGKKVIHNMRITTPSDRKHVVRANIRNKIWPRLAKDRTSYQGVEQGFVLSETNELRKTLEQRGRNTCITLRRILAGGILPVHPNAFKGNEAGIKCQHCKKDMGSSTLLIEHMLWTCTATDGPRQMERNMPVVSADRNKWPKCTKIHGIVPKCLKGVKTNDVQMYLLDAVQALDKKGMQAYTNLHVWRRPLKEIHFYEGPTYQSLIRADLNHDDLKTAKKLIKWQEHMVWQEGTVSDIELVIDFELTTKFSVIEQTTKPPTIRQKARKFRSTIRRLDAFCNKNSLRRIIPLGKRMSRVHTLRSIGGPAVIGYKRRPMFQNIHTDAFLEDKLAKADPTNPQWADDIIFMSHNQNAELPQRNEVIR